MFNGCTSLTTAPELHATTLAENCYQYMFQGCTSLTTAPSLPATTLVTYCYYSMFRGCTSLNSIKCLATDISASRCTSDWVNGVAGSGTFTKAESMSSWTTGINGIPSGWTVQDYEEPETNIRIWIDDFPIQDFDDDKDELAQDYGYPDWFTYIEEYTSDLVAAGSNPYDFTGDTLSWSGDTYYLFEYNNEIAPIEEVNQIKYLLTNTVNYSLLYNNSLEADDSNEYTPFVAILQEDYTTYIDGEDASDNHVWLVAVEGSARIITLWFDDYPMIEDYADKDECAQEEFGYSDWVEFVQDFLVTDTEESGANGYQYSGETFVWNGVEYYFWENISNYPDSAILTDTINHDYLYNLSMEANSDNEYCPYVALITPDDEIYLQEDRNDWLIKVE
jgi:hypothetical protein